MIVLVDMDGVLADFDGAFYALCERNEWPLHGGEAHLAAPCTRHRFLSDCLAREHHGLARAAVSQAGWFRELPLVEGCVDGLERLSAHPDVSDVFICTKPLEANHTCRDEKAAWVRDHLGPRWEHQLVITPDKSVVKGAILLDDAPKLDEWLERAEWEPVIYTTSWNGAGSAWEHIPHWTWAEPIDDLLRLAR